MFCSHCCLSSYLPKWGRNPPISVSLRSNFPSNSQALRKTKSSQSGDMLFLQWQSSHLSRVPLRHWCQCEKAPNLWSRGSSQLLWWFTPPQYWLLSLSVHSLKSLLSWSLPSNPSSLFLCRGGGGRRQRKSGRVSTSYSGFIRVPSF